MKSDREKWIERIKADPAGYAEERMAGLTTTDLERLLVSLASTYGIGEEIEYGQF